MCFSDQLLLRVDLLSIFSLNYKGLGKNIMIFPAVLSK